MPSALKLILLVALTFAISSVKSKSADLKRAEKLYFAKKYETAAALLSRFGVNGIRLADEIEPGVSLGLTLGQLSVPIATKAGAFGDEMSLIRISERLRAVRTKGSFS